MNSKLELCLSVRQHCRDREGEGSSEGGDGNGTSVVGFMPKIDELEILLEAYFVQVDGTLNKVSAVRIRTLIITVTR
jgi:hypothetical protein